MKTTLSILITIVALISACHQGEAPATPAESAKHSAAKSAQTAQSRIVHFIYGSWCNIQGGDAYTDWPSFYSAFVSDYNNRPDSLFGVSGAGDGENHGLVRLTTQYESSGVYLHTLYRWDAQTGQYVQMTAPSHNLKTIMDYLNFVHANGDPILQNAIHSLQIDAGFIGISGTSIW
jgi:hypothetical protein